jgi:hypothetical protein
MTRTDLLAALGAGTASLSTRPSGLVEARKKPGGAPGTYDLRTCYAGQLVGITVESSLSNLVDDVLSYDAQNPNFSCAALLIINHEYAQQLASAENALIQAIANL